MMRRVFACFLALTAASLGAARVRAQDPADLQNSSVLGAAMGSPDGSEALLGSHEAGVGARSRRYGLGLPLGESPSGEPSAPTPHVSTPKSKKNLGLTGFQRFVEGSVGRLLPIAGMEAFEGAPSTFAPLKNPQVPGDYVIGPGDEVVGHITGVIDQGLALTVDASGRVAIPKVGTVVLAGVRAADLEAFLTKELSRSFRNFTLSATLGRLRAVEIYVVGQARAPGKYTVSGLSSAVNAVFASGGPSEHGSLRRIHVLRGGVVAAQLDLYRFLTLGDHTGDVPLQSGDTLVFLPAGPRVALVGQVAREAIFELAHDDEPLGDLLQLSGGLPPVASRHQATLERIDPGAKVARRLQHLTSDSGGLQTPLRDGDIVTFFPISPAYDNAITLRGNVAQPIRVPFAPGMRVKDVIPDRQALITFDYYKKRNLLVQFEEPPLPQKPTYGPLGQLEEPPPQKTPFWRDPAAASLADVQADARQTLDTVNWQYALIERLNTATLTTELIPFHLGKAVLEGDRKENIELHAGDVITVFGESDLQVPQAKRTRLVRIEGEVSAPGVYQLGPGETLPALIARVGGFTEQAYVYGLSLKRASVREAQTRTLETVARQLETQMREGLAARQANIGGGTDSGTMVALQAQTQAEERLVRERVERLRALRPEGRVSLELDPRRPQVPDVLLEADDEIFVPAVPSFVSVLGAVHNENSLLWKQGRTVAQYIDIAGLTESADAENLFVLRADGSVDGRNRGFWAFLGPQPIDTELQPGDVIVVPERVDLETGYTVFMRGLKDWTQILANMGLAAAAIAVFAR